MWTEATHNVTGAFQGFTAPLRELYDEIHARGWTVQKVVIKDHQYEATAKNPHEEKLSATGPNESTAVGNLLMKVMRREHIRSSSIQFKVGMWDTTFESQLQEIAQAFAEAPIYEPKAASAWIDLARDSQSRSEVLQSQLQVEIVDEPNPYKTADEMREDVKEKQHIFVSRAYAHHPVWSVNQVVAFRLVHDVLGHCVGGGDWGWHGSNLAFAAHAPLLSEEAQKALFTEALGQTAYQSVYRDWGPQKIAFLDDLVEKAQKEENKPGHSPVHPSQALAPIAVPDVSPKDETKTDSPREARFATKFGSMRDLSKTSTLGDLSSASTLSNLADPNEGWKSDVDPLPDNAYLWQTEPTTGKDPLDVHGVLENAYGIDPRLGQMAPEMAKQAVSNAFRSALLAPRKSEMHNAQHYQHIMGIPADIDDPMVYWKAWEDQRKAHNMNRGLPIPHLPFEQELKGFKQWFKSMNPRMDDREVHQQASRELLHMLQEEEERVLATDKNGDFPASEVEMLAYQNLQKRLKILIKPRVDDKTDFGEHALWRGASAGPYGSYLASHLRPITGIAHHSDELTDAALEDMIEHKGIGHHFRGKALSLGIPGVTPKVASLAWLMLHPHGSQLGVIDPHVMETLGHDHGKDMNDRDYFKYERELAAGRDASGYGHVPLGPFGWGLYDQKTGGPGFHRDLSPLQTLNPTPYEQVDWLSRQQPENNWSNPYWWESTQPQRNQVADDWDRVIAINHPQSTVPFQPRTSAEIPPSPYFIHPDTNEELVGYPGDSLMQHIKQSLGMDSVHDVWGSNLSGVGKR